MKYWGDFLCTSLTCDTKNGSDEPAILLSQSYNTSLVYTECEEGLWAVHENMITSAHHSNNHCACALSVYITANHTPTYCTYITQVILERNQHTYIHTHQHIPRLMHNLDALCYVRWSATHACTEKYQELSRLISHSCKAALTMSDISCTCEIMCMFVSMVTVCSDIENALSDNCVQYGKW